VDSCCAACHVTRSIVSRHGGVQACKRAQNLQISVSTAYPLSWLLASAVVDAALIPTIATKA
jgi:hypothetical protein